MFEIHFRIREKRKLKVLESRERRRIEKPRVPRSAKKIDTDEIQKELGDLGLDIDASEEVNFKSVFHLKLNALWFLNLVISKQSLALERQIK